MRRSGRRRPEPLNDGASPGATVSPAREEASGVWSDYAAQAGLARFLLRQRRARERALGADNFSDPVWDMMLDLFAAAVAGEKVATSSVVIAASVPQSTALRRLRHLVMEGLVIEEADPRDGRRTFVRLSDELFERIGRFLREWLDAQEQLANRQAMPPVAD